MQLAQFTALARTLASSARRETLPRFNNRLKVKNKGGADSFDPVTEADLAAEEAIRSLIAEHFPEHGLSGEELPEKPGSGRYRWSLDPIDGTGSFICGLPTWTTLIALLEDGEPVLGLIDAPVLDETYLGSGSEAVLVHGEVSSPIRSSGCSKLSQARLSTTDPFLFEPQALASFERLRRTCQVTRYGHDAYAYARLAAGSLDLIVESKLKAHDYHAVVPLIRAAGGHVGNWTGGSDLTGGAIVAAASSSLYESAVEVLAAE